MRLNLAINYGGRTELVDAVNAMLENARNEGNLDALEITEESIAEHLYTAGQKDPDLLIRTSGEMRVSNFLLWQIAYSELYVTETLWPDFSRRDLLEADLRISEPRPPLWWPDAFALSRSRTAGSLFRRRRIRIAFGPIGLRAK